MINARDPRNDPDVTTLPCAIGTGDCEELRDKKATADGYCKECSKPTCRSCVIELESGLFLCVYCQEDIENAESAEIPSDGPAMAMLAMVLSLGCAGYGYAIAALVRRWM